MIVSIILIIVGYFLLSGVTTKIYYKLNDDDKAGAVIIGLLWPISLPLFFIVCLFIIIAGLD